MDKLISPGTDIMTIIATINKFALSWGTRDAIGIKYENLSQF